MQRKLTITIDEAVYEGLYRKVGPRKIARFIEEIVRPHVLDADLTRSTKRWPATRCESWTQRSGRTRLWTT